MDTVFENLKSWVISVGGEVHPSLYRENGSMYTKSTIIKGTTLVSLPDQYHLNPKRFEELNTGLTFENDIEKVVFVFLTELKKSDSLYRPYFESLPTLDYFKENHPFFLSVDLLESLGKINGRIYQTLIRFKKRTEKFHAQFGKQFSLEEIQWAYINFLTRSFEGSSLIPCVDLFNHNYERGDGLTDENNIEAGSNFNSGEEVYISYGSYYDTLELWMSFGFVDPTAKHIVGLHNVKGKDSKPLFPNIDYISECGLSDSLKLKVQKHHKITGIFQKLLEETSLPNKRIEGNHLLATCYDILQERNRILKRALID